MEFVTPKHIKVQRATNIPFALIGPPVFVRGTATTTIGTGSGRHRRLSLAGLALPYQTIAKTIQHPRLYAHYSRVDTVVIQLTTKINAFRGVAGYERGGGGGGPARPEFGQMFPRR